MIDVDEHLARRLVASAFPDMGGLPVHGVESQGWDNRTFRLGAWIKLRFPRTATYALQIEKEARWLPMLAERLHVEIPQVVAVAPPTELFPFSWSMQSWIHGEPVGHAQANDAGFADDVGRFLNALHLIEGTAGPAAGAHSFHRGGNLRVYDAEMRTAAEALRGDIDASKALALWETALGSRWETAPVWVHGDMAAGNLLVDEADGQLSGVIDFGCLAVGDPACDLVIAWTLFNGEAREVFRRRVALDSECWERARGWALWKALITLMTKRNDSNARRVTARVLAEA